MRQTTMLRKEDVQKDWYIIDANNLILGRLATTVAMILRGKNKPSFTSHVDCGDNVIIINAEKVLLSGDKLKNKKYYNHSGYTGGLRVRTARVMKEKYPVEMVERAIKGMLPHTSLGRKQFTNLHVYVGENHGHEAQKPKQLELNQERTKFIDE